MEATILRGIVMTMRAESRSIAGFGWQRAVLAVAVAGAVAMWPACASRAADTRPVTGMAKLDYTLKDINGQDVSLASFRGRPIVLNFWATWCTPCKAEIPARIALADQYKDQQLTVLGVSVDDQPEELKKFAAEYRMNYPVLVGLGQDAFQETYDAAVMIPITWFIRPDGTLLKKHQGPATKTFLEAQIRAMMAPATSEGQ